MIITTTFCGTASLFEFTYLGLLLSSADTAYEGALHSARKTLNSCNASWSNPLGSISLGTLHQDCSKIKNRRTH